MNRRPEHVSLKWLCATFLGLMLARCPSQSAETNSFPSFDVQTAREYLVSVSQSFAAQAGDNPEACFIRARLESQLGRKDQAEHLARQGLERAPARAEMHAFLADLFIRQDRLEEAAQSLRQALQLQPRLAGAHRRLGMVLDRLGDRPAAREAFETAVSLQPNDAAARLLLGRWLLDHGQPKEAILHLEKATQQDPREAGAFYALSQAYTQLENQEAADKAMKVFRKLKQAEKAAMDAEYAASDNERHLRAMAAGFHCEAATFFGRQGREPLAEAHLRQALALAPQEPLPYELLASYYQSKSRWAEARGLYEELVRLRPKQAAYRATLGTLCLRLGDHAAAETQFKAALELEPNQLEALHNLARHYLTTGRELAAALAMSRHLVTIQPIAANYDLLGWASYANRQTNEALAAAALAVEKDPGNAAYAERLRRLVQAAGRSP